MKNTAALAPLTTNPVLAASCRRAYLAALRAEESAPTTEQAWKLASASQRTLRDLQAAQAGQPLPSVVARLARQAKRAARIALSALSTIGRAIAAAMARAAATARRSIAAALSAALTTEQLEHARCRDISDRRFAALRANGEDTRNTVAWREAIAERNQLERSIAFHNWKRST